MKLSGRSDFIANYYWELSILDYKSKSSAKFIGISSGGIMEKKCAENSNKLEILRKGMKGTFVRRGTMQAFGVYTKIGRYY